MARRGQLLRKYRELPAADREAADVWLRLRFASSFDEDHAAAVRDTLRELERHTFDGRLRIGVSYADLPIPELPR